MKVFISWSGQHSEKLGEAIRDWLPGVIQAIKPYFTPSDIDKGTSWSSSISNELSESKIGILCITKENIHSDWILFEAGALSKSLEKSHVCPVLFGVNDTDLAGPLKQFQATEFTRKDFSKLMSVINNCLGDHKLPPKTLESVFEKWWPDLEVRINSILSEVEVSDKPIRSDRDLLEEILQLSRLASEGGSGPQRIANGAVQELLENYIILHDQQVEEMGDYQSTLDQMRRMDASLRYIAKRFRGKRKELDALIGRLHELSYDTTVPRDEDEI